MGKRALPPPTTRPRRNSSSCSRRKASRIAIIRGGGTALPPLFSIFPSGRMVHRRGPAKLIRRMPPQFLFDIAGIDLEKVVYDQEAIRKCNPQRGDMEHLNAIVHADQATGRIIGYKDVRPNEFWVPFHIPGRPLLPGVLMIEAGAQLASFYSRMFEGWSGFVGFSGAEDVRFRASVPPDCRMYILGQKIWARHHRISCKVQGLVNGNLAFEATIIGVQM
jgi:3-hydroxyacyl-[acyl-carrier-protein] dehydratase